MKELMPSRSYLYFSRPLPFWALVIAQSYRLCEGLQSSLPVTRLPSCNECSQQSLRSTTVRTGKPVGNRDIVGLAFSSYATFSTLSAESPDFFNLGEEEEDDTLQILSPLNYLTIDTRTVPPQTLQLLTRVSENYVFGRNTSPVTLRDIEFVLDEEYNVRIVPLLFGNSTLEFPDVGGKEAVEFLRETLSLAALYRLPKEVTVELLAAYRSDPKMKMYVDEFAVGGWDLISFPKGLALEVKQEYRRKEEAKGLLERFTSARRRSKRLIQEAAEAIEQSKNTIAPEKRQLQSPQELLARIEQQLTEKPPLKRGIPDELLFFQNSVPLKSLSLQGVRRAAKRQYTKLKRKGRAGLVSYCFFNFLFYSIGMLWQWPRIATADPLTSSASALTLVARKFGRVFASLYVAAQIVKLPKVLGSIALARPSQRLLNLVCQKFRLSENVATVALVGLMLVIWAVAVGIPVVADYAVLKQMLFLDEQLVNMYGVPPV